MGLICNNSASTCWQLASNRLPILAGPEYGNATKTYTNSTAAAIITASTIIGRPWESDAEQAFEVFSTSLDRIFAQRTAFEEFSRGSANIEIIGRGAGYGAAIMSALCIREMSGHRAAAHTGAGFRHGPNLDVDPSHVAIIFAVGRAADLGVKLAEECNRRGGKVILVSSVDRDPTPSLAARSHRRGARAMGGNHRRARRPGAHARHGRKNRVPLAATLRVRPDAAVGPRTETYGRCGSVIAGLRREDAFGSLPTHSNASSNILFCAGLVKILSPWPIFK